MWKTTWRRWARNAELSEAAAVRIVQQLDDWLPTGTTVAAYQALAGEPSIGPIVDQRRRWLLPRVHGQSMSFHPWDSELEEIAFGLKQPVAGSPSVDPTSIDAMVIPALAFDRHGVRLGRGAGYYDRYLAEHRPATTVGIIPATRLVEQLPRLTHDQAVDWIATEAGVKSVPI